MDLKKTGALIAARRKELGLTQKELADRLQVTDKAISRWETGKGFPETALLQSLAQVLEISITEIVNGELTQPETAAKQADDALLSAMNYAKGMGNTILSVLLFICGGIFAVAPLVVVAASTMLMWGISALCFAWAVVLHWNKWPSPKLAQIISVVLLAGALVLQMIPGSAVMHFAAGPEETIAKYVSCFDPLLWGYAMFMPPLSAVLTVVTLIMALVCLIWKKDGLRGKVFVCTIVAGVFMLLPLLFGGKYLTMMGFFVVLLQFFSAMFQARANGAK